MRCRESLQELTEAGIDEIEDALEVRINSANVTRDKQITFFQVEEMIESVFAKCLGDFVRAHHLAQPTPHSCPGSDRGGPPSQDVGLGEEVSAEVEGGIMKLRKEFCNELAQESD